MRNVYAAWLRRQGYDDRTVGAQLYRAGRVEAYYGDLDRHFDDDTLSGLIDVFTYSVEDRRQGRGNPTVIPFIGDVYGNMNGYKFAVRLYRKFRVGSGDGDDYEAVDMPRSEHKPGRSSRSSHKSAELPLPENALTLRDFGIDGFVALRALIDASRYGSLAQAVASLALFSHPDTVRQTAGKSIFRTVRGPRTPGVYAEVNGCRVMLDDNKSASDAFKWTHGLTGRLRDVQFNHIYTLSQDVHSYTSLANICVTPAFLAKLTDSTSPATSALLKYRVFDLYGWTQEGIEAPNRPDGYADLDWAPPMPAVHDLKNVLEAWMARKVKDRTVLSVREVGWLFGANEG